MKNQTKKVNILLLMCVFAISSCSKKKDDQPTTTVPPAITQTIDCSKTIPSILEDLGDGVDYIVKCNIQLTGSNVLTIRPGVTIQFEGTGSGITITNGAALKMIGTAAKPIVLEGKTATPGSWTGIQLTSGNTENKWEYVTLQHAGGGKYAAGLLVADNAYFLHNTQLSIKNCVFNKNTGYGIWDFDNGYNYVRTVFTQFENNVFTDNSLSALNITIDGMGKLDTKSQYSQNGQKFIQIEGSEGLYSNTTVQKLDVPYQIVGIIGIHQRMTILPGVTLQFYKDAGLNLDAQYKGSGTLIANGTAANPIRFIGYQPGKGVWVGLTLGNNDPEISLNYCIIDGTGSIIPNSSTACVGDKKAAVNFFPSCNNWTNKSMVTNCTISNSGGYGILYKKGVVTNFMGNSYSNNTLDNEISF